VAVPAELEWVLRRALGPPERGSSLAVVPDAVIDLADQLKLAPRIALRTPPELLAAELGEQAAAELATAARANTAHHMQLAATCQMLADLADELAVDLIFLKGMAMQLQRLLPTGARPATDIDVLVAEGACERLQGELLERGFRHACEVSMAHPHHLVPLMHPRWQGVEVHRAAAGLRMRPGATGATADELIEAGLCIGLDTLSSRALAPRGDLLAAHLIVHAVAHHPHANAYFFRLLADLQTLLEAPGLGRAAIEAGVRWIDWIIHPAEVTGLIELAEELARGGSPARLMEGGGEGAALLHHFVAVTVEPGYRARLGLDAAMTRHNPLDLGGEHHRRPRLWWPRHEVLGSDGQPMPWHRYIAWSLARPFRFGARLLRQAVRARR
jgi:hypothetical protein